MIPREAIDEITSQSPVEIYLSENSAMLQWPWRMNAAHDASTTLARGTERYIVDSSYQREDIGLPYILEKAQAVDADMLALVDEYGSRAKTVDSILKDIEIVDDHEWDGDILVPLQPPHDLCYKDLEGVGDWYGIGGVARASPQEKITAAERVRDVAGDDVHLHGLGWGATPQVVRRIRKHPDLVDSIDSKAAYDRAMSEDMPNTWKAKGQSGRGIVVSLHAGAYLVEAIRRMNPELTIDPRVTQTDSAAEAEW